VPFIAALIVAGVLIAVVGFIFYANTSRETTWRAIAESLIQLALVALIGGGLTYLIHYAQASIERSRQDRDRAQEERRRIDERRLQVFRDLVASYNHVKGVRRNLRTLGLFDSDALNAEQVAELRAQMTLLIEAQLSIEAIGREFSADRATFSEESTLHRYTDTVEKYLHDVIKQWECHGGAIWAGVDRTKMQALDALHDFIAGTDRGFRENIMNPMRELRGTLRTQLLERPSREESDESND